MRINEIVSMRPIQGGRPRRGPGNFPGRDTLRNVIDKSPGPRKKVRKDKKHWYGTEDKNAEKILQYVSSFPDGTIKDGITMVARSFQRHGDQTPISHDINKLVDRFTKPLERLKKYEGAIDLIKKHTLKALTKV